MQQNRPYILFTRKAEDEVRELAESKGLLADFLPFIETDPIVTAETRSRLVALATQKATVIFTSANAVRYTKNLIEELDPDWEVHCIGRVTALEVERQFSKSKITLKANNAAELAEKILASTNDEHFYFICGRQRRNELPDKLAAGNRKLEEVVVYETRLTPHKLNRSYDAVVFMSPTAVESFFSANGDQTPVYFCIGKTTATAVQGYSKNAVILSNGPDQETLIDTIAGYYKQEY